MARETGVTILTGHFLWPAAHHSQSCTEPPGKPGCISQEHTASCKATVHSTPHTCQQGLPSLAECLRPRSPSPHVPGQYQGGLKISGGGAKSVLWIFPPNAKVHHRNIHRHSSPISNLNANIPQTQVHGKIIRLSWQMLSSHECHPVDTFLFNIQAVKRRPSRLIDYWRAGTAELAHREDGDRR